MKSPGAPLDNQTWQTKWRLRHWPKCSYVSTKTKLWSFCCGRPFVCQVWLSSSPNCLLLTTAHHYETGLQRLKATRKSPTGGVSCSRRHSHHKLPCAALNFREQLDICKARGGNERGQMGALAIRNARVTVRSVSFFVRTPRQST